MLSWLSRWGGILRPGKRRRARTRSGREQSTDLFPTLQVRLLEERRVFHAGAIVAPTDAANQPEPPPPATTVTLDAGRNLLVQDSSPGGQNDQLSIRLDVERGCYEIFDPANLLQSDIDGATGTGTNRLYIPLEVVSGERLIIRTGAGDDSLAVDLSEGLGGKSLAFDGGEGADALTLVGGSHSTVGYLFSADGSTQIQTDTALLELSGVEPIFDYLAADSRQFTIGAGVSELSLGDDGITENGLSRLATSMGASITFASPQHSLALAAHPGSGGRIELNGTIDLYGGDLTATGDTIRVAGSVVTHEATIELSARSSLVVSAESVFGNPAGRVLLDAGAEGTLQFSGRIDVRGLDAGQAGGTVHLLGRQVELLGMASIDASGMGGGGTVLVGGDLQGLNPAVRRSTNTLVEEHASIRANGLAAGDGGKIIVWADEAALVAGSGNLQARGGAGGGDGGLIETSGKQYLYVKGAVDASSRFGSAGTWLLDPHGVDIVATSSGALAMGSFTSSAGNTTIAASTIVAALQGTDGTDGTNVTINTGAGGGGNGDITVDESIAVALGVATTRTLTLNSHGIIDVRDPIAATAGKLNVVLNATVGGGAAVSLDAAITTNGGSLTSLGTTFENSGAVIDTRDGAGSSDGNVTLTHTGVVTIAANMLQGSGTATITGSAIQFGAATLFAQAATLSATAGAITSGSAGGADIDTSAANGTITLSAAALGTSPAPLELRPGTGSLDLTAISGGVFLLLDTGDLLSSRLSLDVQGVNQTISLATNNGHITFDSLASVANTTDDHFQVSAGGSGRDVTFSAATALSARSISVTATRDILSTTSTTNLTTTGGGAISLSAGDDVGAASPILVQPGGPLSIVAGDDINLRQTTGNLSASAFTTLRSTGTGSLVSIGALAGSVLVDSVTGFDVGNDTLEIFAAGAGSNVSLGTTLTAGVVRLSAAGNIAGIPLSSSTDISATSGVDSIAGGGIGAAGEPLIIQPGLGSISAATSGSGAAGSIYLQTPSTFVLDAITTDAASTQTVDLRSTGGNLTIATAFSTNDQWVLGASGNIGFGPLGSLTANSASLTAGGAITGSSGSGTDIDTSAVDGAISLLGMSLGASGTPLQLSAGTGSLGLTASTGDIFVNLDAGELRTSRVMLSALGARQTIALSTSAGPIVFDSMAGFSGTADDHFQVTAGGGGISFTAATLAAHTIELTASGGISGDAIGRDLDTSAFADGTITLNSGGGIGASGTPLLVQAGGTMNVTAGGDIYLRQDAGDLLTSKFSLLTRTGAGFVSIGTRDGAVTVDNAGGFVLGDDGLEIVATGTLGAPKDILLSAALSAGNVRLEASGAILSNSAGPIDIIASGAAGGDIALLAFGTIGASGTPISIRATGDVVAQTTAAGAAGDIYLISDTALLLGAIMTDGGSTQTVSLETTGPSFTIGAANASNDHWIITSGGAINFQGTSRIVAHQVDLIAAGAIIGGAAAIDIDTSPVGGAITLNGTSLGAGDNALVIHPGSGQMFVTATGNVYLDFAQTLSLSQFAALNIADNASLDLSVLNGSLFIDRLLGAASKDQQFHFSAAGAGGGFIVFLDNPLTPAGLLADAVSLTATADILNFAVFFPGLPNVSTTTGPLALSGRNLGEAARPLQVSPGAGLLDLFATQNILVNVAAGSIAASRLHVDSVGAGQTVFLSTTGGSIELDGDSFVNLANDNLTAQAGGAGSNIVFGDTSLAAANMTLIAAGSVRSGSAPVDAIAADRLEIVAAGGDIGTSSNRFTFSAPRLFTTSAGSQYLAQPSATSQTRVISAVSGGNFELHRGRYLLAGQIDALGTVTLAPDALLGGVGSVSARLLLVEGTVDPGYFAGGGSIDGDVGTILVRGDATIAASGKLVFDINPPYETPGSDFDQLLIVGTLLLREPELELHGARELQQSIDGIEIVSASRPVRGGFEITGPLIVDGRSRTVKVVVGSFRGDLIFNGASGNGIVLGDLSLLPPAQQVIFSFPRIRLPVLTVLTQPVPTMPPPPPLPPPPIPSPLEVEADTVQRRYLEVRIVVPIDDAGNVREQAVMELPAEMLTDLPALFRRLPDDRYRIYLMLKGSAEERLVIDVLVRDGRPIDAGEAAEGAVLPSANPATMPSPANLPAPRSDAAQPQVLPDLPTPGPLGPTGALPGGQPAAPAGGRLFAGVGLAAAAVVAGRSAGRWSEQVDRAAERIGSGPQPRGRWWRGIAKHCH